MEESIRIIGGSTTTLTGVVLLLPWPSIALIVVGLGIMAKDIPLAAHRHGRVLNHSRRGASGVGNMLRHPRTDK